MVTAERPETLAVIALITELEMILELFCPRESRHRLSVERQIVEAVPFLSFALSGACLAEVE